MFLNILIGLGIVETIVMPPVLKLCSMVSMPLSWRDSEKE